MQTNKVGWLTIWNAALEAQDKAPLDLKDRDASQVWRFELRLGSKQLRNRFEMLSWQDVRDIIGDAFADSLGRIRYCTPPQTLIAPVGPPTDSGSSLLT